MVAGCLSRRHQLDVVDLGAAAPGHTGRHQRLAHRPGITRQFFDRVHVQRQASSRAQEEPVAAPGHVTDHGAKTRHLQRDARQVPVGGHVVDRHLARAMQFDLHRAHRRVERITARLYPAQVFQRGHQADGPVAAHAQITHVVEEHHRRQRAGLARRQQHGPHQHVVAARLAHGGAPVVVVLRTQPVDSLCQRLVGQVRETRQHNAGRLAAGMRIDAVDFFHGGIVQSESAAG